MNFALFPMGSHGDVHPFLGLALQMQKRGHGVSIATNGLFRDLIERHGIEFHEVGTAEEAERIQGNPDVWHPRRGLVLLARQMILPYIRRQFEVANSLSRARNTTLVGSALGFGVRFAHEVHGFPYATLHLQPSVLWSRFASPRLARLTWMSPNAPVWLKQCQYFAGRWLLMDRHILKDCNAIRESSKLAPIRTCSELLHSPQRVCAMFPEWYAPTQPDWPVNVVHTGFPLWDENDTDPLPSNVREFLDSGSPPIVFTPGTGNSQARTFFKAAVGAIQRTGQRGIFLTRHTEHLPEFSDATIRHFEYVPLKKLMPHAAAIVYHGGIGTLSQALVGGIPQLVVPMAFDQPDNSERILRLGVGTRLWPSQCNAALMAQKLKHLLESQSIQLASKEIAKRLIANDGLKKTCDHLEKPTY